jgi:hypothetical protein
MVKVSEGTFNIGDQSLYSKTWLVSVPVPAGLLGTEQDKKATIAQWCKGAARPVLLADGPLPGFPVGRTVGA